MSERNPRQEAVQLFREHGGQLRMREAIDLGMSRYMLYSLLDTGIVERISRGVYRLAEMSPVTNPDLVTVALRVPRAVVCLVSALSFHEMTTQVPHAVSIAIPRRDRIPSLDFPPVHVHRFSGSRYDAGVQSREIDGTIVKVYSPEKTLADCFAFRNRIGIDIALEALRIYLEGESIRIEEMLRFARIWGVERVMRPYLEASL